MNLYEPFDQRSLYGIGHNENIPDGYDDKDLDDTSEGRRFYERGDSSPKFKVWNDTIRKLKRLEAIIR